MYILFAVNSSISAEATAGSGAMVAYRQPEPHHESYAFTNTLTNFATSREEGLACRIISKPLWVYRSLRWRTTCSTLRNVQQSRPGTTARAFYLINHKNVEITLGYRDGASGRRAFPRIAVKSLAWCSAAAKGSKINQPAVNLLIRPSVGIKHLSSGNRAMRGTNKCRRQQHIYRIWRTRFVHCSSAITFLVI